MSSVEHRITAKAQAVLPLIGRKVLVIVENLAVPFDRRVWQECLALRDAGAQVVVICPTMDSHPELEELRDGIRIYRHPLPIDARGALGFALEYGAALLHWMRLTVRVARRHGFDTLHGCNPPDLIFLVAIVARWVRPVRFIFDHHDIAPELFEAKFGRRGPFWHLLRRLERWTFRTADVVISTNESYRDIALTRGGKAPEDVFIVRSGPDLRRVRVVPPNRAWAAGAQHLVGYVGTMGQQEGIDLLLEAARLLVQDRGLSVRFVVVGGGPELPHLQRQAQAMGLSEHVHFTGRVADDTLFEVLSTADLCINPDRVNPMNTLSTMNKILEYMAFSKPIVQFEGVEGQRSAAGASVYARANDPVDLAERIAALLADPARCARMGAEGRARIEGTLSWDHQVPNLIAAYQRAAEKR